ncbi:MAG: A/G-specific adenine glycosylase [Planktomarina sp.]
MREHELVTDLLMWYDRNARLMPWRTPPADKVAGVKPDPYRVWMSEIMLQQTTVAAVKDYFVAFTDRWPTVQDLAAAEDADVMAAWAGLGYYARARNLLKCARVVTDDHGGQFPADHAQLLKLPGIGPYTAAAVGSIAFDLPVAVLDGNVERVMARMFDVQVPLPTSKPELMSHAERLTPNKRPGDYAQAVMDLGATICTPRSPACGICPWRDPCQARQIGNTAELPKKLPKIPKPIRVGVAYVVMGEDGSVLLEQRPDKGLLGGMKGFYGSEWAVELADHTPPLDTNWIQSHVEVRHTFTHFHLRLSVMVTKTSDTKDFTPKHDFRPSDLPTVFQKVWNAAQEVA